MIEPLGALASHAQERALSEHQHLHPHLPVRCSPALCLFLNLAWRLPPDTWRFFLSALTASELLALGNYKLSGAWAFPWEPAIPAPGYGPADLLDARPTWPRGEQVRLPKLAGRQARTNWVNSPLLSLTSPSFPLLFSFFINLALHAPENGSVLGQLVDFVCVLSLILNKQQHTLFSASATLQSFSSTRNLITLTNNLHNDGLGILYRGRLPWVWCAQRLLGERWNICFMFFCLLTKKTRVNSVLRV